MQRYPYPDGTYSSNRPADGQTWVCPKTKQVWMWDDMLGQWYRTVTLPNFTYFSTNITVDTSNIKVKNECECGSEKCGSNRHSTWCPKYDISV